MIETIELINFQHLIECKGWLYQSRESFLPINYEFKKGNVYGFVSDFGCGSWGLSTCLGGWCSNDYSGKILLNNNLIFANQLTPYSCFVTEKIIPNINSSNLLLTPQECIAKALKISKQDFQIEEIRDIFCLSKNRFERSLDFSSGEIWHISMAINFALGKDIFCYPWLNLIDIGRFKIAVELNIIDFLKQTGKIIFVPSSQEKILKKYCDHTITFGKDKIKYR